MDGRADPYSSNRRRFAARCNIRAHIAVLLAGAERTASEGCVLPRGVSSAVQTRRRVEITAFFVPLCSTDGRDCNVFDIAVGRQRLCGRNADRNDPASSCAVFRVCGAVPAADRPNAAVDATEPFAAYGGYDPSCVAYVSPGRFDRQRKSSQRTDHGASCGFDRPGGRPTSFAGTVYEAVRQRRSVRRAAAICHASLVRKRDSRLYLRTVARADRKGTGNRAGNSFTV